MRTILRGARIAGADEAARDVKIEDGRIVAIGTEAEETTDEVVDVTGMVLFPGLIDLHTHLTHYRFMERDAAPRAAFRSVRQAEAALRAGITAVRDTGSFRALDLELRSAIHDGVVAGPRMFCAGGFISMTGGHGHPRGVTADGPDAVRKAAREQLLKGANFIKIMCSGGVLVPGTDTRVQYSLPELRAAAEEAEGYGTYLAAHAHPPAAIQRAIEAGATYIEHGSFVDAETAELMAARGVTLTPTFAVYSMTSGDDGHADLREASKKILERKIEGFRLALDAGVRWAVGSDSGTLTPATSIVDEVLFLHEVMGIDLATVLHEVTKGNAERLGVAGLGEIAVGAPADIICLPGDPYTDPKALRTVNVTVADGRVYDWRATSVAE